MVRRGLVLGPVPRSPSAASAQPSSEVIIESVSFAMRWPGLTPCTDWNARPNASAEP